MTSAVLQAEADQASLAFHVALTQIGVGTVEDALKLWAGVPPTRTAATSGAWLARAVHLVMTRRARSRELALAYYRLVRALRTGSTIADPRKPEPLYVSLNMLRREFTALAGTQSDSKRALRPDDRASAAAQAEEDPTDRITVERLDHLDREQQRLEREAEREATLVLDALGPKNLERKLKAIDTDAPATDVDELREDAHRRAGTRQAAAAERVAMDGARSTVWMLAQRDKRVVGYARISRTGTPCGWCAMLISRGAVYKSAEGSSSDLSFGDLDKYHDGCHCYAEPIYSREQFDNSPLTALNRRYKAEWKSHIADRGFKGKAALTEWRRRIRQEQRDAARLAHRRPGDAA
ncbi:hypothetical protein JNUCC0626_40170 [Lentzea sp. JNUCC 0626]|uniref:VG15 protein n=1 Tax=Lentzea sp. JNUCC 0626 TaxID=3367513 RepID=UPI00374A4E29